MRRTQYKRRVGFDGGTWERRHAPQAEQWHTAECQVHGPGTQDPASFNPDTGTYATVPGRLRYEGDCRVQRTVSEATRTLAGEQRVPTATYQVSVRIDTDDIRPGDEVTFLDATDAQLRLATLHVVDVQMGTLRWERLLFCTDDLSD